MFSGPRSLSPLGLCTGATAAREPTLPAYARLPLAILKDSSDDLTRAADAQIHAQHTRTDVCAQSAALMPDQLPDVENARR